MGKGKLENLEKIVYAINSFKNGYFTENINMLRCGIKPIFKVFYGLFQVYSGRSEKF
jgi:hypothetical protein